jgi:hypothetical protein
MTEAVVCGTAVAVTAPSAMASLQWQKRTYRRQVSILGTFGYEPNEIPLLHDDAFALLQV